MTAPVFSAGTIVAGRYTIEALLGKRRGRATYRAICAPNRHVALKILDPLLAGSEEERALVQAATVAAELPEGAVLGMIDHGIDAESGAPFLVSPLSDHPSLEAFVSLCPLSLTEMATMARSLARGLDAAHRRGLAHLAIRPTNVFVGPPPVCWTRVSDFGAGAVDRGTDEGGERDTLAFAAPELYAGSHGPLSADAAARADVFSAALLCFYAATGDTYWKATRKKGGGALGADIDPLVKETSGIRAPTSVAAKEIGVTWDPKLDAAFARALSHSPAARFGSVGELAEALADALNIPSRAGAANLADSLFKGGAIPPTVPMDDDDDGPATSVKNVPRIAPQPVPAPPALESVAPAPESIAPAGPRPGASSRSNYPPEAPREQRWGGTLVMELEGPSGPPRPAAGAREMTGPVQIPSGLPREVTGPVQIPQGLPREMTGPFQVPQGLSGTMLLDTPPATTGSASVPAGPLPAPAALPRGNLGLPSERPMGSLPPPHHPPLIDPSTPTPVAADAPIPPAHRGSRGPVVAGVVAAGVLLIGVGAFLALRGGTPTTTASSGPTAAATPPKPEPVPPPPAKSSAPVDAPAASADAPTTPAPEASGPIPTTLGQQPKPKVDALDPPTTWYAELVVNCEPACSLVLIQGGPAVNPSIPKQLPPGQYIVTVQQSGGVQSQSPLLRAATRTTLTFDGKLAVPPPTAPVGESKPKCTGFLRTNCK